MFHAAHENHSEAGAKHLVSTRKKSVFHSAKTRIIFLSAQFLDVSNAQFIYCTYSGTTAESI
jgi:hypothetical protein